LLHIKSFLGIKVPQKLFSAIAQIFSLTIHDFKLTTSVILNSLNAFKPTSYFRYLFEPIT
ncbi:hypothetical protein, partial [Staphylococcus aureus]